jgi:hypothetical protein
MDEGNFTADKNDGGGDGAVFTKTSLKELLVGAGKEEEKGEAGEEEKGGEEDAQEVAKAMAALEDADDAAATSRAQKEAVADVSEFVRSTPNPEPQPTAER